MADIAINSFPINNTEELQYELPQNIQPYSTINYSSGIAQDAVKMRFRIEDEDQDAQPFGTHLREAVGIVKDWVHSK
jgi:hypothetical protein